MPALRATTRKPRRSRPAPLLLPNPKRLELRSGRFELRDGIPIVLAPAADAPCFAAARALQRAARQHHGITLPIEGHRYRDDLGPHIALDHANEAPGIAADTHRIRISSDVIEVVAGGAAGLRYAVETLIQLITGSARVPALEVDDAPDFELRGIMLDVSRGKVPTSATLREVVDLCVKLKLNVLMLYTEHTFRFRRHPEIGANDSPLDAETMRELDDYASERCVDLIPCLQSLGHMEHVLELDRYRELAETDIGWTIAPVHPGTAALLRDLYDDYLPNFRSRFFNANCDEPWDLGRGQSKARSQELGPGGLYLEHIDRLRELAAQHDKRMMIWGDVVHAHPERIAQIDPSLIMLDWWYEADFDYDRVARFVEAGLEFGVCPGTSSWNSLFPRIANSIANVSGWAEAGRKHGARALVNTDWGDFGHYNLQGNSWLGFAWGAQQSWSGEVDAKHFDRAFSALLFGDSSGTVARIYRELGAIHDPGFAMFNGSALQYLFFDDAGESYFISGCKDAKLTQCERRLESVSKRIAEARAKFGDDELTWQELAYAADASLFAVRKSQAVRRYNEWRKDPACLSAGERRKLARRIDALAKEQSALGRRLRRLWLARSAISNFDVNDRRLKRSVAGLRRAARALERGVAPPPPKEEEITGKGAIEAVRRSIAP